MPEALPELWKRRSISNVVPWPEISALLTLEGDGDRLLPLTRRTPADLGLRTQIASLAVAPTVRAGLYLYFDFWEEAHETAQNIAGPEGSYWHAIVHRQEPDAGNSGYWFRQAGRHPVFPALREQAAVIGLDFGPHWNPTRFIEYCEEASRHPGSEAERRALETQRAEWQLLFDYCVTHGAACAAE